MAILRFAMGKQIAISDTRLVTKIFATRVEGMITLPAQTGKLEKFTCANVTVVATSKDLVPRAPGEFGPPKWVRTGKAKMIARKCTYSIIVPPSSAFYLTAGGHGRGFACTSIEVLLNPSALGPHWVPLGMKKTVNLSVQKVTCSPPVA